MNRLLNAICRCRHHIFLSVFTAICFFPALVWAQQSLSLPADQLLEYSIAELNQRMKNLAEDNMRLKERNAALRRRMDFLKGKAEQIRTEKGQITDEMGELKDDIELETQESSIIRMRASNINEHNDFLLEEYHRLQDLINDQKRKHAFLRENIEQTKGKISKFVNYLSEGNPAYSSRDLKARNYDSMDKLKEARIRIRDALRERNQLKERLGQSGSEHASLKRRNHYLKNQYQSYHSELKEHTLQSSVYEDSKHKMALKRDHDITGTQKKIASLKKHIQDIEDAIARYQDIQVNIQSDYSTQKRLVSDYLAQLEQESRILVEAEAMLRGNLTLSEDIRKLRLREVQLKSEAEPRVQAVKLEFEELRVRIEEQEDQHKAIYNQKAALNSELSRLQNDLDVFVKGNEELRKQKNSGKSREIERQIRDLEKMKTAHQKQVDSLNAVLLKFSQNRDDLQQFQHDLRQKMEDQQQELTRVVTEQTVIEQQKKNLVYEKLFRNQQIEEEIQALRMRSEVLNSTLVSVDAKYDKRGINASFVSRNQTKLADYFSVLKRENHELQEQYLSALMALDRLKSRKNGNNVEKP